MGKIIEKIMEKITQEIKQFATAPSRNQRFITCPHCWTEQRTERDFCYRCGTRFIYLDEKAKKNPAS